MATPDLRAVRADERDSRESVKAESGRLRRRWSAAPDLAALFAVFAITVAVTIAYHFGLSAPRTCFLYDGMHYLETCSRAADALAHLFGGQVATAIGSLYDPSFSKLLLFDGPVVPLVPSLVFQLLHRLPWTGDWQVFVLIYAVMQGVSAALVCQLTRLCTTSRIWGLVAGLAFGLYPPTVFNAGQFMSEPPVTLLLISFALAGAYAGRIGFAGYIAGVFGGAVMIAKAALIPAVLASSIIVWSAARIPSRRILTLSALLLGALSVVAPWYLYTQAVTGSGAITTQRLPSYNAAVGVDLETDAWCTGPESPHTTLMRTCDSPPAITLSALYSHPGETLSLGARKLARLFACPWNNCRWKIYGLDARGQQYLHLLLLTLGTYGAVLFIRSSFHRAPIPFDDSGAVDSRLQDIVLRLAVMLVAGHFAYVLFQPMSRYGFTAMPFIIVLAVWGAEQGRRAVSAALSSRKHAGASAGKSNRQISNMHWQAVLAALALPAFACNAETLIPAHDTRESLQQLEPGARLVTTVDLSSAKFPRSDEPVLLLADGDREIERASLQINGHQLEGGLRPAGAYRADWYAALSTLQQHAEFLDVELSAIRQWRAVPISRSLLNTSGMNEIVIANNTGKNMQIYGGPPGSLVVPSPQFFASDRMLNSADRLDPRVPQTLLCRRVRTATYLRHAGGRQPPEVLATRPRVLLVTAGSQSQCGRAARAPGQQNRPVLMSFEQSLPAVHVSGPPEGAIREAGPGRLPLPSPMFASAKIPEMARGSHLRLLVRGKVLVSSGSGRVGIQVVLARRSLAGLTPALCPAFVKGRPEQWTDFTIEDLIPQSVIEEPVTDVILTIFPCPWTQYQYGATAGQTEAVLKDMTVSLAAVDAVDLTGKQPLLF